jgi:NAD(P)-dependent dehydrogenase (short-subunit alcohol dehydrogenase family)
MDLQLAGEVAVVIGSASGLGKAIAQEFAREAANLVLVDISLRPSQARSVRRPTRRTAPPRPR